jgi:single-strand DNA-binding protein
MLNRCAFIGNLGADPEIRSFQNGGKVANLRLAVSEKWKNKDGEKQERTEWVSIAIFSDGLVGVVERFLKKGSKVYIEGKLQTRKWQDQNGQDRYSTEIVIQGLGGSLVMLDGKQGSGGGDYSPTPPPSPTPTPSGDAGGGYDDLDDDIPF